MEQQPRPVLEYYQLTFRSLMALHNRSIHTALLEDPRDLRRHFLDRFPIGTIFSGQEGADQLRPYLELLEKELKLQLHRRSVHYWIHLYRRISPRLVSQHENKTDPMTILLVRDIAECAIAKYGKLGEVKDLRRTSEISPDRILGGRFLRTLPRLIRDERSRRLHLMALRSSNQFVICDFELKDFLSIHRVEGLAYEYWLTTARLRSIGKGDKYILSGPNTLQSQRDEDLNFLLRSFDERLDLGGFATLPGTHVGPDFVSSIARKKHIFAPLYNATGWKGEELLSEYRLAAADDSNIFNFAPRLISMDAYLHSHSYAAASFEAKRSYPLESFLMAVAALSLRVLCPEAYMASIAKGDRTAMPIAILTALKRAYCMVDSSPASIVGSICSYLSDGLAVDTDRVERVRRDLNRICADLTLDSVEKQDRISLWTRGPRFPVVPGGDAALIDAQGIQQLLRTLFVGIRHSENNRGISFESELRAELERCKLELVQRRYDFPDGPREIDAAVRADTTLWLIEAHSMERPLDYEIGKPAVVLQRNERLASKLNQAASIREQLHRTPVGPNYDVSWATRIEHCVASPFVEWIWTRDKQLWINPDVPRVLSASELILLLTGERGALTD